MKLGIDFGTNRIVVAAADRGNYPLVSFECPDETNAEWYPSLIAVSGEERRYGWEAWEKQTDPTWTVIRSIKRLLENAGPYTVIELGEQQIRLTDLLNGLAAGLYAALRENSNLRLASRAGLEIVLGVPANSNSNQRFLTVEAFRAAGFSVAGVLNEPSAASIEFGHRQRQNKASPETILVYDLGGGTFDASLVVLEDNVHQVVASEGIPTIGGDDFDHILADLALEAAGIEQPARDRLSAAAWFRLLEECRLKKESLNPNSRRVVIELEHIDPEWGSVQVPIADFYEAARPLVEETIAAAEDLLVQHQNSEFEALYITGGGSELPLVARVLRERFGRRVRRSAYTRSATAIGLAIQADQPGTYRLSDRLARFFGVWRETDSGSRIIFDSLFDKGISLPVSGDGSLTMRRSYSPVHNVGHFRFLECSHRSATGIPTGDITLWDEIRFPFDPSLETVQDLNSVPVSHFPDPARKIEELYQCDSGGSITATITNHSDGYSRTYRLGSWSQQERSVKPVRRRGRAAGISATAGA